jgi:tetratricopeptide (TPR) repeat protein
MKNKSFNVLIVLCLISFTSYSQSDTPVDNKDVKVSNQKNETIKTEPHRYGGWYCPDNLNGFPAVDISNWESVPVVNGRMATKEETHNGASLIFVDALKYPNAKALDITMPKLASFYNKYSNREDLIIVIQAINVDNDSIVGFRYLNGGNGSARLNEVRFLADNEIEMIPSSRFVSHNIEIKASQDVIWKILTNPENAETLQPIFDKDNKLKRDWRKASNVNYHYPNKGILTGSYAGILFGNFYIQNDYNHLQYNEKFLLLENRETKNTELKIVSGPYGDDFETQKMILNTWAQKVKELSEKEYNEHPPISIKMKSIIESEGTDNLTAIYMELRNNHPDKYDFSESHLNELGYYYMGKDDIEKALAILKLNIEAFPNAYNVYDSYGEALLKQGAREEAIENYKKSVKLNPENEHGINVLKELGVSTDD